MMVLGFQIRPLPPLYTTIIVQLQSGREDATANLRISGNDEVRRNEIVVEPNVRERAQCPYSKPFCTWDEGKGERQS